MAILAYNKFTGIYFKNTFFLENEKSVYLYNIKLVLIDAFIDDYI